MIIHSIKSPLQVRKPLKTKEILPIDASLLFTRITTLIAELEQMKEAQAGKFSQTLATKMGEVDTELARLRKIQKGEKGDTPIAGIHFKQPRDGKDGASVDEVATKVLAKIKQPKDGKDAVIDYDAIVQMVLDQIPMPQNGKDAEVDEEALTERVFNTLSKGKKKISTKHIDGWQDANEVVRRFIANGSIRGGGDIVMQGTGVTITNVDGKKVISATGGAGFTPLDPTETPNGSLTVFTFAAATAQPSYIISDSVWMKATTKSGTINWTWNAGTKQATMTVPPQDDVEGIA